MDFLVNPTVWLIAGGLLIVSELIVPGGIVVFLGVGCLIVSAATGLGLVETWMNALTLFFISSLGLILILRGVVMRYAGGDSSEANTVELLDEIGHTVEVVETIGPGNKEGRIDFRGTEWPALGDGSEIPKGASARIVSRQNVQYLVEPVVDPVPNNLGEQI